MYSNDLPLFFLIASFYHQFFRR